MRTVVFAVILLGGLGMADGQENRVTGEAAERKANSIAVLKREGVPYIEHLPVIETAAEIKPRSTEEVALNWLIRYSNQEWDDISTDT